MIVEVTIAKDKVKAMPKGSVEGLRDELIKRLGRKYEDLEVIVKAASNDGLSVRRTQDKEGDKAHVEKVVQEAWESADEWFYR
ncbi:DinI-like family protein [Pantoea stewartii]|uniref:DinI-like family protein n=1 Tax=Pantoea stewartii TaxID=66269 RepID=UPI0023F658EB|nr:DinI-like family protein [Pantoea stewartii]MDF7787845.1 DinI-like family protein [Pantoea stewartii]